MHIVCLFDHSMVTRPPRHPLPLRPTTSQLSEPYPGYIGGFPQHDPILLNRTLTTIPRRPVRKKRQRTNVRLLQSILYQSSFYFFILVIAALLVGSAWGLGEQAWKTGDARRWNIAILVAAYVALGISAIIHLWSRLISIKRIIRTMPKPYMPTKQIDVPKRVADHIMTQYSRTAVIAHISQATKGEQEGWGRPGSKWENQHFRTYILGTLPTMMHALRCTPGPPLSLDPLFVAADEIKDSGAIRLFVNSYANLINKARFSGTEPDESDAVACDKIVDVVLLTWVC
ncbi:hypothetical protein BD324DRAFT_630699 [Kockovaella imperatae]|uniref:Defect at low temperature protein 1 n=1 Tax=Kockovaella imperatae TaxID=4999 RepID=A0A1Y1UC01_9TREE|nr:hypothetical protein BD324DRAFT_630699 [Kockovaella imperatae]ORX35570.1 hypothetical protein BD324DRAFT_630699 [Kockovaella imperatae]